jgi:hypothetical protein
MDDNVETLRLRWTPEKTAAALRFLQGDRVAGEVPLLEQDGKTWLDLRGIRFGQTQLDDAIIRDANLRWSIIHDVGFKGAQLIGCDLTQSRLSECYFRRTVFRLCEIVNARFERDDFSSARIEGSRLDFTSFRECEITLQNVRFLEDGDPRALARLCRGQKLNAMAMGHFADAGELTFMEKTFDRRLLFYRAFLREGRSITQRFTAFREWAVSMLLNLVWGYGEKPQRLVLAMAAAILLFRTLQYGLDGIPGASFGEHLYFSGIIFLTIGYGDLLPVAAIPRLLAVIEGVFGITVLGMLIASCPKKIMYR